MATAAPMINFGFAFDCLPWSNCARLLARLACFDEEIQGNTIVIAAADLEVRAVLF